MAKYVVFKIEEYEAAQRRGEVHAELAAIAVKDAWVIRKQDTHAASTAYAYANAVQSTIEILETLPGDCVPDGKRNELEKIRDAAFEYAESARATQSRLPD
jgi:hypothetical protein